MNLLNGLPTVLCFIPRVWRKHAFEGQWLVRAKGCSRVPNSGRKSVSLLSELCLTLGVLDLRVVIKRHPDITEAKTELDKVQAERKKHGDGQRAEKTYDEEFPPFDAEEWDPPLDSDSEDVKHTGNGKPCRFYNHGGCGKGALCDYSHAPDDKSIRDDLYAPFVGF